jgi:hypothetical protein
MGKTGMIYLKGEKQNGTRQKGRSYGEKGWHFICPMKQKN